LNEGFLSQRSASPTKLPVLNICCYTYKALQDPRYYSWAYHPFTISEEKVVLAALGSAERSLATNIEET
jgi:hypothetical protein